MPPALETKIDRFVDEIAKRGKMTFPEAAKFLDVSVEQVEDWGTILGQHVKETNIKVRYPTVGEPEIITVIQEKKEEVGERVVEVQEKSNRVLDFLSRKHKEAKTVSTAELPKKEELSKLVAQLKDRVKMLQNVEKEAAALRKEAENIEAEEEELTQRSNEMGTQLDKVRQGLDDLVSQLQEKLGSAENVQSHLTEMKKAKTQAPADIKVLEKEITDLNRELNRLDNQATSINVARMKTHAKRHFPFFGKKEQPAPKKTIFRAMKKKTQPSKKKRAVKKREPKRAKAKPKVRAKKKKRSR